MLITDPFVGSILYSRLYRMLKIVWNNLLNLSMATDKIIFRSSLRLRNAFLQLLVFGVHFLYPEGGGGQSVEDTYSQHVNLET